MNEAEEGSAVLTEQARATISDLIRLIDELNSYTEQLRALVAAVETGKR